MEKRLHEVVEGTARLYGAKATLTYKRDYPVTRNHERQTAFAAEVAPKWSARSASTTSGAGDGGGGFLLHAGSAARRLHLRRQWRQRRTASPGYNFNDEAIPVGTSYWVKLVETALRG